MAKSAQMCIDTNDLEEAIYRYKHTRSNWKNHWWNTITIIYNSCKDWAEEYILDPIKKTIEKYLGPKKEAKYPEGGGLYLLGNTAFNPFTEEKEFWVKVGQTVDFKKRMRSYVSHNPTIWQADFLSCPKEWLDMVEESCHKYLLADTIFVKEGTKEWFKVDAETYLKICKEGFDYFPSELKEVAALVP